MCDCSCHGNLYAACDQPGGCGTNHTGNSRDCVLCALFRPDSEPRLPHRPPVCDGDRTLLDRILIDVANLHADLVNPEPAIVDQRTYQRTGIEYGKNGQRRPVNLGTAWADPTAPLGGVAPINSRSRQPSVAGSKERPIPINAAAHDLKTRLRPRNQAEPFRGDPDDQIGRLPAAVILAEWVRDIRDTLYVGQHLPKPGVDDLVLWLRTRIEDICDRHPAIVDMATELRDLRGALRAAAGQAEPRPEPCIGVPCRRCDLLTLFKQPGGDVECVNPDCQAVLRAEEYAEWTKALAPDAPIRHANKVARSYPADVPARGI
ncbi:hypothetical protein AB0F72_09155 [Actinoplanes sp. NPDC023936]|uniref:hypothetical protein n=1 Tax=Actinoplanes sp. NPDC023936 TaxID=3154910 RepID=UPI0033F4909A